MLRRSNGSEERVIEDGTDKQARGLTYSDMAILVRAWKDTGPIGNALRKAEVPFIGGGMNSLLDTPEAQAVCNVFYFLCWPHPSWSCACLGIVTPNVAQRRVSWVSERRDQCGH